ncbi:MAG: UDP-N-acetylmuramoyl-L-alanyl-D-glutamate--2,6-diaminopimelate ligase [Acidobacteria bacterium]|nr:UDP-N-acetylmuramoyl-L-alanyl-D-glutamate--2,6-diaminopimelate ligase [Acidobacteriota bacterium]
MTIGELMPRLSGVTTSPLVGASPEILERTVAAITYDSRRVEEGAVFVAVRGQQFDGTRFVPEAVSHGAVLVVASSGRPDDAHVPWLTVTDERVALAELSAAFYGDPSQELTVVGVTGTNGKTTTTYLISAIFDAAGWSCGRIGSVGYRTGVRETVADRTTPEAPEVQSLLRKMVDQGCTACAMEVSSHALGMRRVEGTQFAAAVFSNLTRDHLDYHPDMEHYFATKRRLFEMLRGGAPAIINVDDPYGEQIAATADRPVTYGITAAADVSAVGIDSTLEGSSIEVRTPRGHLRIRTKLLGRLNVYNVLAAVATAVALDVPFRAIEQGVSGLDGVPGRFEVVSTSDDDVSVIVDFAHTDDALRSVLAAVRELCHGRVITVFGCGGNRDAAKRPLMGAVADRLSDLVVVTSDNPRHEEPDAIIAEIRLGIEAPADSLQPTHVGIADRGDAIGHAVDQAKPGDAVVIAGKGHETHQLIGEEQRPFNDRLVALTALDRRRARVRFSQPQAE